MKKKMTIRDQAINHYQKAHTRMYGVESHADLSGVATDDIWKMGDACTDLANTEALDCYEGYEDATIPAQAFSELGNLLG